MAIHTFFSITHPPSRFGSLKRLWVSPTAWP
nr:MAG TPA: hypothetical protein [Caudoviricetes sp.]